MYSEKKKLILSLCGGGCLFVHLLTKDTEGWGHAVSAAAIFTCSAIAFMMALDHLECAEALYREMQKS